MVALKKEICVLEQKMFTVLLGFQKQWMFLTET